jgi:hypothetical protein
VHCHEPDAVNLEFLRKNLDVFGSRVAVQRVVCVAFADVLSAHRGSDRPLIVKPDVEGIERELMRNGCVEDLRLTPGAA